MVGPRRRPGRAGVAPGRPGDRTAAGPPVRRRLGHRRAGPGHPGRRRRRRAPPAGGRATRRSTGCGPTTSPDSTTLQAGRGGRQRGRRGGPGGSGAARRWPRPRRVKVLAAVRRGPLGLFDWTDGSTPRCMDSSAAGAARGPPPGRHPGHGDPQRPGQPTWPTATWASWSTATVAGGWPWPGADGLRLLAPARLGEWEPWWAMTIHKSQGSEFAHAVVVLPTVDSPILTRELLYTAVTRAQAGGHRGGHRGDRPAGRRAGPWPGPPAYATASGPGSLTASASAQSLRRSA